MFREEYGERPDYEDTSRYLLEQAFEQAQNELDRLDWERYYYD